MDTAVGDGGGRDSRLAWSRFASTANIGVNYSIVHSCPYGKLRRTGGYVGAGYAAGAGAVACAVIGIHDPRGLESPPYGRRLGLAATEPAIGFAFFTGVRSAARVDTCAHANGAY